MSDEKIDLADLAFSARLPLPPVSAEEVLALVRAVRAARAWAAAPGDADAMWATQDALAPFTDSAEVRSDGE